MRSPTCVAPRPSGKAPLQLGAQHPPAGSPLQSYASAAPAPACAAPHSRAAGCAAPPAGAPPAPSIPVQQGRLCQKWVVLHDEASCGCGQRRQWRRKQQGWQSPRGCGQSWLRYSCIRTVVGGAWVCAQGLPGGAAIPKPYGRQQGQAVGERAPSPAHSRIARSFCSRTCSYWVTADLLPDALLLQWWVGGGEQRAAAAAAAAGVGTTQ